MSPAARQRPGARPDLQRRPDMDSVTTPLQPHVQTLESWSAEWIGFSVHLKPKTRIGYESLLRTRIVPAFGDCALDAIDGLAIRRWVADMHAGGLSPSRIRQSYRLLRQMLASAVDCGLLDRDPSHGVKMPRDTRREMSCLTAEEVERLAATVAARYRPLIHVLAYGGLRWGEGTALRRHRCDLDGGRLIVAESLADVNGRVVFGMTKTYRVRKTRIPAFLVDELRTHLETVDTSPNALVFTAPRGGPLR